MAIIPSVPLVLCISGHDPSGGAGIQADIEAIGANGCHACSIISCLTRQNTCDLDGLTPVPAEEIVIQADTLLRDCSFAAIKLGLLPTARTVDAVADVLTRVRDIPVVLDPVLRAGSGARLAEPSTVAGLRELLPSTTLVTPNSPEARILGGVTANLDGCAAQLLDQGCEWVLITGTHEVTETVVNRLYHQGGLADEMAWPRLAGNFHGSGCTLASAIAARLASGDDMVSACRTAQTYTWQCLSHALTTGRCQHTPDRLGRRQLSAPDA